MGVYNHFHYVFFGKRRIFGLGWPLFQDDIHVFVGGWRARAERIAHNMAILSVAHVDDDETSSSQAKLLGLPDAHWRSYTLYISQSNIDDLPFNSWLIWLHNNYWEVAWVTSNYKQLLGGTLQAHSIALAGCQLFDPHRTAYVARPGDTCAAVSFNSSSKFQRHGAF